MPEVVAAFGRVKERQTVADGGPEFEDRAAASGPEQPFQFRKPEFDRIEVGTIGRQIPELRAGGFDPLPHPFDVMGRQVIHDDDVARAQRGREDLVQIGEKGVAIHRSIQESRCGQPIEAEGADKRAGLPVLMGRVIVVAAPSRTPPVATDQVRRRATFIKKHEAFGVNRGGGRLPRAARGGDVGTVLFGRAYRFF